jgi:peptidyl-tRNA hydrolase
MPDTEEGEVTPRDAGRLRVDVDELRIYIVFRRDVGEQISKPEFGVQCAHAALTAWLLCFERDPDRAWAYTGSAQAKIVLQVNTEAELRELHEHARSAGYAAALVTNAGRNELEQPRATAVAIGPIWFKAEGKLLERLRLYKDPDLHETIEEASDEDLKALWYQAGGTYGGIDNFLSMVAEHGPEATKLLLDDLIWADRRAALYNLRPACPACGHEEVELQNMYVTPTEWRCRLCKHEFTSNRDKPRRRGAGPKIRSSREPGSRPETTD